MSVSGVKCPSAMNSAADGDYGEYRNKRAVTQDEIRETVTQRETTVRERATHKTQQINPLEIENCGYSVSPLARNF